MSNYFFLDNKRHLFLHNDWYLHFDDLNSCLMNLNLLILNPISICLYWNLFDNLIRYSLFNIDLNRLFFDNSSLDNPRHLDLFIFFFFDDDLSLDRNLNWYFNLMENDLRNLDLNNLQLNFLANYNFFNDFGDLYYLFNYARHNDYFLYYLFYLNDPRDFYYLLHNPVDKLSLNLNNFFLLNNRHGSIDLHNLHNFLSSWYDFDLFNLNLFDFF